MKESYDDCFYSRLIFTQSLDVLLPSGTGVLVKLYGDRVTIINEDIIKN